MSIHESAKVVARFPDEFVRDAYTTGFMEGYSIGKYIDPEELVAEWADDTLEVLMIGAVCETEERAREFSPFEFTAKAFNEREDADEVWSAYEAGVSEGARWVFWVAVCGCTVSELGTGQGGIL